METIEPATIGSELIERDEETGGEEPVQIAPPVVAVVVTHNPGPWLEETLGAFNDQDYPALGVLVLDNASHEDPTPRIAAAMPRAFVRRRTEESDTGFGAAANDALAAVEGATFLLFCHDDVAPDRDAVRIMVEEAYRSNAGIVGPKIVDHDHPELLLEVGMAVDHYGVPFSGIEPDEVDQEQHDSVRDVFYVSHTAMLVRTDLFHELGGFDAATFPGADDVDLCWRARLAGARVIVAPDARVSHRQGTVREARPATTKPASETLAETKARVRVIYKSYSALALLWVLPVAFVLELVEAIGSLLAGHIARARALVAGWVSVFAHPGELRHARAQTQKLRRVDDGDVRPLMIHGSARLRTFVTYRVHAGERMAVVSSRTKDRMSEASGSLRRAPALFGILLAVLILFGSRSLLFDHVPQVGAFRVWPGVGAAWATFTASWRTALMGSPHAATPVFAFIAALRVVLLGHGDLARSLVVGGALPVGAFGAYRLVRPFASSALPGVAAAIAYAANPIVRNAIWQGELGPLMCFAIAPFVLSAFVRATSGEGTPRVRGHAVLTIGLLGVVAGAAWPPAIFFAALIAVACGLAWPFVGDGAATVRALAVGAAGSALAGLLLVPWSLTLIGADPGTWGAQPRASLSLASLLSFHTGQAGAGLAPWGILAAAVVPLVIARGERFVWAARAWVLAVLSFALAWLPARLDAGRALLPPDGLLVGAAIGLAFAAGLGVAAILDDLHRFHFGWRQVLTIVAAFGLIWALFGFAADTRTGRFGLSGNDWATTYSWMQDNAPPGGFRTLWLGDPTILPADARDVQGVGYALTRNGPEDARALWAGSASAADRTLGRAIAAATSGSTARLGHLLAPAGIRYIAFIRRAAPDAGARGRDQGDLGDALGRQLDLTLSRVDDESVVYQNDAWLPMHAFVPTSSQSAVNAAARDPLTAPLQMDNSGAHGVATNGDNTAAVGPGTLLWSEAANSGWKAEANGATQPRTDAFGWTNQFALQGNSLVRVQYHGSIGTRLLRVLEVVLWFAVVGAWLVTRRTRRRSPALQVVS